MTVLKWGSNVGGFQPDPGNQQAGAAFGQAAEALLRGALTKQPPDDLQTTPGHPAVVLLRVDVAGRLQWCLTYRGRDAAGFAKAGGCRFVFADGLDSAAATWDTAVVEFPEINPAALGASQDGVASATRQLLHAAVAGNPGAVIRSGGVNETADVLEAMRRALAVIPESVAANYAWATFPLHVPPRDTRVLTGPVPAEFARTRTGMNVQNWVGGIPAPTPLPELLERVVDWLTDQALAGQACIAPNSPDGRQFVHQIVEHHLPIDVSDVAGLIGTNPALLTGRGSRALGQWVDSNPAAAINVVVDQRVDAALRRQIGDYLLVLHDRAPAGSNPVAFPPQPEPVRGWHNHLAQLINDTYPDPTDRIAFLQRTVTAPGRPLAAFDDRCSQTQWFRAMGVDHVALADPSDDVALQLESGVSLPPLWVSTLQASDRGDEVLRRAVAITEPAALYVAQVSQIARSPEQLVEDIFNDAKRDGFILDNTWLDLFAQSGGAPGAQSRLRQRIPLPPTPPPDTQPPTVGWDPGSEPSEYPSGPTVAQEGTGPSVEDAIGWLQAFAANKRQLPREMADPIICYLDDYAKIIAAGTPPASNLANAPEFNAADAPEDLASGSAKRARGQRNEDDAPLNPWIERSQSAGFALLYLLIGFLIGLWIVTTFTGG